jgi:NADH-quinone oxidoreductase subunit M
VIYDRMHTREIRAYGGLVHRMPIYATIFMLFTMGNVGLPGTSGFVGEFLSLMGAFQANTWAAFFATSGVIFSACYALWLYKRVIFGEMVRVELRQIPDVTRRELMIFAPLIVGTVWLGVNPSLATDMFGPAVTALVDDVETKLAAWDAIRLAAN